MKIYVVEYEGSKCVFSDINSVLDDIRIHLEEYDAVELEVKVMEMAEEQYNNLPEFEGW